MHVERTPHGGDLRKGRRSEPGRIYLITTVTADRRRIFVNLAAARLLIGELKASDVLGRSVTWAVVLMPDHLLGWSG